MAAWWKKFLACAVHEMYYIVYRSIKRRRKSKKGLYVYLTYYIGGRAGGLLT